MPASPRSDPASRHLWSTSRHLWLIGMMGSGKTTVGRLLAQASGRPFVDVDDDVVAHMGCSIAQLWGERGERGFRDLESAAIERVAAGDPAVVATGGGAVLNPRNVDLMRATGTIVWLDAGVATLRRRVGRARSRPLLADGDVTVRLADILSERRHRYAAAADLVVDTDGRTAEEVAESIEAQWNES